jgi:hypothetical protein
MAKVWQDEANITGQPYVERPFWYENLENGQTYYDLYGCIGWPTEVSDKDEGIPGYAAVVGVIKPKAEGRPVKDSLFQLLAEFENKDVPTLLDGIVALREVYGFRLYPGLMQTFWGDPDRFISTLALYNERLTRFTDERDAILVAPPIDFYLPKAFDQFVRSFRATMMPDKVRFFFGKNEILRNRLKEFRQSDPAVTAIGGLVHSLLNQCMWMDHARENMFVVEEGEE